MEQDFPGFVRDLGSFALIVNGNNFRKISGRSIYQLYTFRLSKQLKFWKISIFEISLDKMLFFMQ